MGEIVSQNQHDWCERVPVAAVAYRASVHEATGYSHNMLVLGREVAAPLDVILGCLPVGASTVTATTNSSGRINV